MAKKFAIGEIAIVVARPECEDFWNALAGTEVKITGHGRLFDYKVELPHPHPNDPFDPERACFTDEDTLRKRPQQDDNLFTKWFESHIITDIRPTETQVLEDTMRRVQGNLQSFALRQATPSRPECIQGEGES